MGCTKETDDEIVYFACPYIYSRFPSDKDAFAWVAVTEEKVPVYEDTSTTSKIIDHLSYELLPFDGGANRSWFKVKQSNEMNGYIERQFVHSPNDYRIIFRKENKQWFISSFVAGD